MFRSFDLAWVLLRVLRCRRSTLIACLLLFVEMRKQKRKNYYEILGVPTIATINEIKAGYKKAALEKRERLSQLLAIH